MDRLSAGLLRRLAPDRGPPGALEQQTEALWTAENGLIDQLDVNKATWGLSCWEASLGLDVDVSRPDAYRRTRILSKLRGQGTTTVAMIQNVAESFYNGQVAVEEQPEAYRFDIRFLSSIGVPPNLDDLSAALEEIKPAHLAYDYIILYRTWGELEEKTWGELESRTWDEILGGEL
ncbi:MAG: putative phage tail protein [Intestinimonas sp.]